MKKNNKYAMWAFSVMLVIMVLIITKNQFIEETNIPPPATLNTEIMVKQITDNVIVKPVKPEPPKMVIMEYRQRELEIIGNQARLGWVVYLKGNHTDNKTAVSYHWYDIADNLLASSNADTVIVKAGAKRVRVFGETMLDTVSAKLIKFVGVKIYYIEDK